MSDNNNINSFYLEQTENIAKIGCYQLDAKKNSIINITAGTYSILETDDLHDIRDLTNFMDSNDKKTFIGLLKDLYKNDNSKLKTFKHIVHLHSNNKKFISHTIKLIKNSQNEYIFFGFIQDITERYNHEREMSKKAYYDTLTNLPNRAGFEKSFNKSMMLAKDIHDIALLLIDLDDFKKINDTMGHNVGDKLLRHITDTIKKVSDEYKNSYSDYDYVFTKITPARFGGDEFVISFPYNDFTIVEEFTKALLNRINTSIRIKGNEIKPSVSIGISKFPQDGENFMTLLKKSDLAMYKSKHGTKNTYTIYSSHMSDNAAYKFKTESELFDAIKNNQLVLYYQPKMNLQTGKICGFESLIRWNHPQRGLLLPGKFITIAEESDLIFEITNWVIDQCIKDYMRYFHDKDVILAMNLSAKQFNSNLLAHKIFNLTSKSLDTSKFEFEITESVLMGNIEQTISMLDIIKSKGFKCAIDDFGSGYSSFNYIKKFPIDTLKLDKAFIDNITTTKDRAIVKSVAYMAKELGLNLIIEGVEEKHQLDYIMDINCDQVQGFILSEALSLTEIASEKFKQKMSKISSYVQQYHMRHIKDKTVKK